MNTEQIIKNLAEKRKSAGMTQKELADATGLTQSVIARMESGRVIPQIETLLNFLSPLDHTIEIVPKDKKPSD